MKTIRFPIGANLYNQFGFKAYIGNNCFIEAEEILIIEDKPTNQGDKNNEYTKNNSGSDRKK